MLGNVATEQVFRSVDVLAEVDVVHFSDVALVKVLSNQDLEQVFGWWEDLALLEDSSELLGSYMAVLRAVVVLELWLDQDSIVLYLSSNSRKQVNEQLFFFR